jgi:hypothetical protein
MKEDEIARANESEEFFRVRLKDTVVDSAFSLAELTPVSLGAVKGVVEPLGDPEELRCPLDDQPSCVYAQRLHMAEQGPQHFRHASAGLRRVHVPEDPTLHSPPHFLRYPVGLADAVLPDERSEEFNRLGADSYLLQSRHLSNPRGYDGKSWLSSLYAFLSFDVVIISTVCDPIKIEALPIGEIW